MPAPWNKAVVTKIEDETHQVKRFYFEVPEMESFDFIPGQFVTFDLPIHEKPGKRMKSYSIASRPDGTNTFELVIVLLEGGLGTTYLFTKVEVGTEIPFRGPLGKFVLPDPIEQDICMVCTGTGIAPFRSSVWDIYHNKKPHKKLYLIFGTRYMRDTLYYDELKALSEKMDDFEFIVTLSREDSEEWDGETGYVHAVYERLFPTQSDVKFFLCGWRVMIDEARKRLAEKGYDRKSIHFELYD